MNKGNIVAITLIFILIVVFRSIGIENIPFQLIVIILILCMVGAFIIALKYKGNRKERIYLLVMTALMTLLASICVIAVAVDNNYPQISEQYKPIFLFLMAIVFISLLIVAIANAIYKSKNKR